MAFWQAFLKRRGRTSNRCRYTGCMHFFAAIAIVSVNVGLESPGYLMIVVPAMGFANQKFNGIDTRLENI